MDFNDRWDRRDKKRNRFNRNISEGKNLNLIGVTHSSEIDNMWEEFYPEKFGLKGVIVEVNLEEIRVLVEGEIQNAIFNSSINKNLKRSLIVGDIVDLLKSDETEKWILNYRYSRKSFLARIRTDLTRNSIANGQEHILAANTDYALIVVAAKNPEFHPNFVDRYLILCEYGNITPIICYNKVDLVEKESEELDYYRKVLGINVVSTSTQKKIGLKELLKLIDGKTSILVGQSGVGKTSLVNALIPESELVTKSVGEKTHRGKHTTTSTQMYQVAKDTLIIDSPGIRALDISLIGKETIRNYFKDFTDFATSCKHSDCMHKNEPDCGIKNAVEKGLLNKRRYESYLRLIG